ncbi:MAG: (2Fe-2S)-binding protein [Alphaproteobacteria bacterium]|nr:(2Fe-2S)-binding protein [Alphaproteobacteria bacterium]MBM3733893.1 (2Fe-2S)-binding protein [Acidimicrobiia bacterium]
MFRRLHKDSETLTITIDDVAMTLPAGSTVAAALLASGNMVCRKTPVSGADRAPYCLMGVCFDCLVEINGEPNQQACMVVVRPGMAVKRMPRPAPVAP